MKDRVTIYHYKIMFQETPYGVLLETWDPDQKGYQAASPERYFKTEGDAFAHAQSFNLPIVSHETGQSYERP